YSLRAFKVNSIDYLLKPIDEKELQQALSKYSKLKPDDLQPAIQSLQQLLQKTALQKSYKERFLLKSKDQYTYLLSDDIAYFYSEDSTTFLVTLSGKRHLYEEPLAQLEEMLNPKSFFRINRKQIIHLQAIGKIHQYFNSRLKVDLRPSLDMDNLVSREKVKPFKAWLDR
ncbi:MAG: LytTR family DNA-binding domain-containing protein, partial [Bacteroidota bacterium]